MHYRPSADAAVRPGDEAVEEDRRLGDRAPDHQVDPADGAPQSVGVGAIRPVVDPAGAAEIPAEPVDRLEISSRAVGESPPAPASAAPATLATLGARSSPEPSRQPLSVPWSPHRRRPLWLPRLTGRRRLCGRWASTSACADHRRREGRCRGSFAKVQNQHEIERMSGISVGSVNAILKAARSAGTK